MRLTHTIAAAGLFAILSSARADSPIPTNHVDDFSTLTPSATTYTPTAVADATHVEGTLEELQRGSGAGEPGSTLDNPRRDQQQDPARERFLNEVWARP
jgi:hypothetical protein